jgi:hypothetical protein
MTLIDEIAKAEREACEGKNRAYDMLVLTDQLLYPNEYLRRTPEIVEIKVSKGTFCNTIKSDLERDLIRVKR